MRSRMSIARRRFVGLLGSAVLASPRVAASQLRELRLIGLLHAPPAQGYASDAAGFAQGLEERGFVEAQNLAVDYRFAGGRLDRLAMLAADLVRRPVALIVAGGATAALAARAATATIPIVVISGFDPARLGLGASLDHPVGNVTGVTFITASLMTKRLGFLHELVPRATTIGYLASDGRAHASDAALLRAIDERKGEIRTAADALGWQVAAADIGG